MDHKEKCRRLKKVRKAIADKLGINLHQTECTYEGDCPGTCPKCRKEEEMLNKAILGTTVATAGIMLSACTFGPSDIPDDNTVKQAAEYREQIEENREKCDINDPGTYAGDIEVDPGYYELEGDVAYDPSYDALEGDTVDSGEWDE